VAKEIGGSLEYKTAIVDRDFLTVYFEFLHEEEMTDLDIRVGTETETYTEMTMEDIFNDLKDKDAKITSINITAYERRELSNSEASLEYYKRRRRIAMSSYGTTLNFSISGTNQVWVGGTKASIDKIINEGTWLQKFLRGESLWLAFYVLCFYAGALIPLALVYSSVGLAILGIVALVVGFGLAILLLPTLRLDAIKILPYSYEEKRAARRLSAQNHNFGNVFLRHISSRDLRQ
jgi:hypothetical protein